MLRARYALMALVPALAFGFTACAGDGTVGDPEGVSEEQAAMIAPAQRPIGTFRSEGNVIGKLSLLVLKSDRTYHDEMPVACITAPCYPVMQNGRYSLLGMGGSSYLYLYANGGTVVEQYRYQYSSRENTLSIMKLGATEWTVLREDDNQAWCAVPHDCELQDLTVGICASRWYCSGTCSYPCRPPPDADIE